MITKVINVNLHQPIYERLTAKQGDIASRYLLFHLLDGDKPFDLSNRTVRVYAIKPDKTEIFNDLTINDASKGYCTLELTSQCLASAGVVKMELYISESRKVLTSIPFELEVIACINTANGVVSTNEFSALEAALGSLQDYDNLRREIVQARKGYGTVGNRLNYFDSQVDVERKRIDSFISLPDGSTSGDAELIDGRIGANGATYENIGTNIREIAKGKAILNNCLTPKKFVDNLFKLGSELLFTDLALTEGYYLDPNDGGARVNNSYGYTDFIAVEPGDRFYCIDTSGLYCKYNYNKELLGGGSLSNNADLTIDDNTFYIKLSIPLLIKSVIKFKKYKFFINARNVLRNLSYYVDKNGNGDFIRIQDAINMIPNNGVGTVYINDGEYEEALECWGKTVHLIGMSKKGCILFNYNDDYARPPLEIGRGSVQNMTIKSINKTDETSSTAYGIHIEDNNLFNGSLQIINCRIESGHNYAIGMGLRGGCDVEFNNCELIGKKIYGGLFFHDAINPEYKGEQNITIKNCVISSQDGGFLMRIQSQNVDGSTINMEFINNIIRTPVNPSYQGMHFANDKTHESTTKPTDFNILTNFNLSPMSCGNNIDLFNH